MIASERTYQNRRTRILARVTPSISSFHIDDVRRDVLWLAAELDETRAALAARIAQDDAQKVGV